MLNIDRDGRVRRRTKRAVTKHRLMDDLDCVIEAIAATLRDYCAASRDSTAWSVNSQPFCVT